MEPFLLRALAAGLGLAVIAAPLGCLLVWQRMAFFGEAVAQASLIGVALGLAYDIDTTAAALGATVLAGLMLIGLSRQKLVPLDSVLSVMAHSALAFGVLATALVKGRSFDLMGFLFGDILAVGSQDLLWVAGGAIVVAGTLAWLWQPLLSLAVHEELAAAEGVDRGQVRAVLVLLLALVIAVALKIVGVLLTVAFLIIPAVAARPFSSTPERMVGLAAAVGMAGVIGGLWLSYRLDTPGGPSIVAVLALIAAVSLIAAARKRGG